MKPDNKKIKQGVLFALLGIPGTLAYLAGLASLISLVATESFTLEKISLATVLFVGGIVASFIGIGKWGQWRYLSIYVAIPIAAAIDFYIMSLFGLVKVIGFISIPLVILYSRIVLGKKNTKDTPAKA